MKIIKPGVKKAERPTKRFQCNVCYCIFECDKREWSKEEDEYRIIYYTRCPECGGIAVEIRMR